MQVCNNCSTIFLFLTKRKAYESRDSYIEFKSDTDEKENKNDSDKHIVTLESYL